MNCKEKLIRKKMHIKYTISNKTRKKNLSIIKLYDLIPIL